MRICVQFVLIVVVVVAHSRAACSTIGQETSPPGEVEAVRIPSVRRIPGYQIMLPLEISPRHLAFYSRILDLNPTQTELAKEFHRVYLHDWADVLHDRLLGLVETSKKAAQLASENPNEAITT